MDKKHILKKSLDMLIQDLAEAWIDRATEPRKLETFGDGICQDMIKPIHRITGKTITSKTIKKYIDEDISTQTYHYNVLAACWFVEKGLLSEKDINELKGGSEITKSSSYWNDYLRHLNNQESKVKSIIGSGTPEGETLEYKDHVPKIPYLAQLICSFANVNGGNIIFGIDEANGIEYSSKNLKADDLANTITKKAIESLSPKPKVEYGWVYMEHKNMMIYLIEVAKFHSHEKVASDDGVTYVRQGEDIVPLNPKNNNSSYGDATELITDTKFHLTKKIGDIKSILHNLTKLYNYERNTTPITSEGKLLLYLLFSAAVNTFTDYLADTFNQISITKKRSRISKLSSLNPSKKFNEKIIAPLKTGNIKAFLSQLKDLDKELYTLINKHQESMRNLILTNHLLSVNNGIVNSEFQKLFPTKKFILNTAYSITPEELNTAILFMDNLVTEFDLLATKKYKLDDLKVLK